MRLDPLRNLPGSLHYKLCAEELAWVFGTRRGGSPGWVNFLLTLTARFPRSTRHFPARGPFLSLRGDGLAKSRGRTVESPTRPPPSPGLGCVLRHSGLQKADAPGGRGVLSRQFRGGSLSPLERQDQQGRVLGEVQFSRRYITDESRWPECSVDRRFPIQESWFFYPAARKSSSSSPLSASLRSSKNPPIGASPTRMSGTV